MIELRRNNDAHDVQLTTFATTENKMNHLLPINHIILRSNRRRRRNKEFLRSSNTKISANYTCTTFT